MMIAVNYEGLIETLRNKIFVSKDRFRGPQILSVSVLQPPKNNEDTMHVSRKPPVLREVVTFEGG